MGLIPRYESRENITTTAPGVEKNIAWEMRGGAGGALAGAGEILGELKAKMDKLRNDEQSAEAQIEARRRLAELEDKINQNSDVWHATDTLDNDVNKISEEASKKISDPQTRQEFNNRFGLYSIGWVQGIKGDVRKKQIDQARVNAFTELDLEKSNYIYAQTPKERLASEQEMNRIIDSRVQDGVFSAEAGYKLYNKTVKDAQVIMKDNEEMAKRKEKEIELARELAVNQKEDDFVTARIKGELTPEMVRGALESEEISPRFAEAALNTLKSAIVVNAETNFDTYSEIMTDIVNPKIKASEVKTKILSAYADGKLSDSDRNSLLFVGKMGQKPIYRKAIEEQHPGFLKSIWNKITSLFNKENSADVMSQIASKAQNSGEAGLLDITKEIINKKNIELNPEIIATSKKGQLMVDAAGNRAIVYSDGSIEELASENKEKQKEKK